MSSLVTKMLEITRMSFILFAGNVRRGDGLQFTKNGLNACHACHFSYLLPVTHRNLACQAERAKFKKKKNPLQPDVVKRKVRLCLETLPAAKLLAEHRPLPARCW